MSPVGAPRGVLVDGIVVLGRMRAAIDAVEARFVAAIDSLDDQGVDAAAVLRSTTRCSGREASRRVRRAEAIAAMPNIAAGFASAAIPVETVDALARAAAVVSPDAVDSDRSLLAMAGSRPADLAARDIRDWIRRHRSADDADEQLSEQRNARRAAWFVGDDGMFVLHSVFDPVTGAAVRAQLDAETDRLWRSDGGRDGSPDDVRSPAQRRCDAVARVLGLASPHEADLAHVSRSGGRVGATVIVVADIGVIDGTDPDGRCEIIDTGPVPASVLSHLPPETTWHGALFNGPGRPLWLGRGRRLANRHQRLMAAVRDRGCVNCAAPAGRCQTHHVREWVGGGSTDVDNLVLLCQRCHTMLHDGHIRLRQQHDGAWTGESVDDGCSVPHGSSSVPRSGGDPPTTRHGPSPGRGEVAA